MFSKRSLPDRSGEPEAKRFKANMEDLLLSNDISADRAQSLLQDASYMNDPFGVRRLAASGKGGALKKNTARDLKRKITKSRRSGWPPLYKFSCRLWDTKQQKETTGQVSMLLPHEMIASLIKKDNREALLQKTNLCTASQQHVTKVANDLNIPEADLIALALWGDGVPFNWNREESLEVFTICFPGASGQLQQMRLPISGVSKRHCTANTYNDILAVFAWSMQSLAAGTNPVARHDGTAFSSKDSSRLKCAGTDIGARAVCCEIRGDWSFFKHILGMPGWNEKLNCCYKCHATPANRRDASLGAAWRGTLLTHWDMMVRWLDNGLVPCPVWSCPGLRTTCCQVDWLHSCDLGVAADFLGNLFHYLVSKKIAGRNVKIRTLKLWDLMQQYYAREKPDSRLDNLSPTMIKQDKKSPKLRGRAGEVRNLVPFGLEMAQRFLSPVLETERAMLEAAGELAAAYKQLSHVSYNHNALARSARRFCLLATALEAASDDARLWKCKPKMHMWLHLCEAAGNPANQWLYRDEDSGGAFARWAHRRGGRNTALSTSTSLLSRFAAKNVVPSF